MAKKESFAKKTNEELTKLLADSRAELRAERFAAAGARAKNPNQAKKLRKTIARALTETHARASKESAA